jgi:uncharacterized protein YqjF (DUF2071 family)
MHPPLKFLEHRPWSFPAGPWIMAQKWHDLLFAHWPVPAGVMRKLVPPELELDCYDRQCWIGIVPFRMSGVRLRRTPAMPVLSAFPELNVRTYVTAQGKPGVWFFSLDAANRIAVEAARAWFHLPYFTARMECRENAGEIRYRSERVDCRGNGERLEGVYVAQGKHFHAPRGTLEYFLTERYCLYARRTDGVILHSEIHHGPWDLQHAQAAFTVNTMAEQLGVDVAGPPPLLHFSRLQEVVVWPPRRISV